MPVTTPPRQPQPLFYHSHQVVGQKDSYLPSVVNAPCSSGLSPNPPISTETPASKATEQSIGSAQTPTKIAARPSVDIAGQKLHGYEVKNTFIHYGSPLKTVSVVTPPKTVPCDFRPEVLFFDRQPAQLRTPAAVYHSAATPSTAGGALTGRDIREVSAGTAAAPSVFLAPPPPPPPSVPFSAASNAPATTLRLSDFLNSPQPMTAAMGSMGGGAVYNSAQAPSGGASYGWQQQQQQPQPCAYADTMPAVPPLPGQSCQAPCAVPHMAASQASVPPPPPPPQFSVFDPAASMQTSMQPSIQCPIAGYDPMAFMSGDPQLMSGGMSQMLPQLPPQCLPPQQPPSFPVDQTSYQLSSQCGVSSMGGASYSGASMVGMPSSMSYANPMNMASTPTGGLVSCGSMVAEGSLNNAFCMPAASAGNSAFSISADHFPQPGSTQGLVSQMPLDTPRLPMDGGPVDMRWM